MPAVDATKYSGVFRNLRYLVNTIPDLAYSAGRFMETPTSKHWPTVKHILRDIKKE